MFILESLWLVDFILVFYLGPKAFVNKIFSLVVNHLLFLIILADIKVTLSSEGFHSILHIPA
jgi:hypothetical protein